MLTIRQSRPSDTSALVSLRTTWSFEQTGGPVLDPDFEDSYRAWAAKNPRTVFVAELDGVVIGMMNLMVFERMPKPGKAASCWVYLGNAYVTEAQRNKGIGGQLLAAAIQFSRDINAARIVLSPSEESRTFYARNGFKPAAELFVKTLEY